MSNDKYELCTAASGINRGEPDLIANLSNASAAINEALEFFLLLTGLDASCEGKYACTRTISGSLPARAFHLEKV